MSTIENKAVRHIQNYVYGYVQFFFDENSLNNGYKKQDFTLLKKRPPKPHITAVPHIMDHNKQRSLVKVK